MSLVHFVTCACCSVDNCHVHYVLYFHCRIADEDYMTQIQDEEVRMTARGYNPKVSMYPRYMYIRICV